LGFLEPRTLPEFCRVNERGLDDDDDNEDEDELFDEEFESLNNLFDEGRLLERDKVAELTLDVCLGAGKAGGGVLDLFEWEKEVEPKPDPERVGLDDCLWVWVWV
jgi:hypothetical protein